MMEAWQSIFCAYFSTNGVPRKEYLISATAKRIMKNRDFFSVDEKQVYRNILFNWSFHFIRNSQRFWCIMLIMSTNNEQWNDQQLDWNIRDPNRCTATKKESNLQAWRWIWISFVLRLSIQVLKLTCWSYGNCHLSDIHLNFKLVFRFEKIM